MAEMTRAEARGVLQQLVKQQQAVVGLAAVLEADAALEAGVAALRVEHNSLESEVKRAKGEAVDATAAVDSLNERLKQLRSAIRMHEATRDQLQRDVENAKRNADAEIKQHAKRADDSRQAQLAEVQRTVTATAQAADAEHAERLAAMRTELEALQARKETIAREVADMLGRFSAR